MAPSKLAPLTMVTSVDIRNFRGFEHLVIDNLPLVNVIVGDNGIGKTAILEAIYLAASGNSQQPLNLKKMRGQDVTFQSTGDSIADAIYSDLFHDAQSEEPVVISLKGAGFENRRVEISRSRGDVILPTKELSNRHERGKKKALKEPTFQTPDSSQKRIVPISLKWVDQFENVYHTRAIMSPMGVEFEGTNERLPNCFFYASQTSVPAVEAALHFSALRKTRQTEKFRQIFLSVFDQIINIDIAETGAGSVLVADVPWAKELLPLPLLSGGTNRAASGNTEFFRYLPVLESLTGFPGVTDVVLMCDTGDNAGKTLSLVKGQIKEANKKIGRNVFHDDPTPNVISTSGTPRLHLLMLPNGRNGGLETVCVDVARDRQNSIAANMGTTIEGWVNTFADSACVDWSTEKRDKLRLQAFLSAAWGRKPDVHFSQLFGLTKDRYVPLTGGAFNDIRAFLTAVAAL